MAKKSELNKQVNKVFHSNLIYFITASGFFMVCIVGLFMEFDPITFFVIAILGTAFFYVFSIFVITNLIANIEREKSNQQSKYSRAMHKYNLLNWKLKSKIMSKRIEDFKDTKEDLKSTEKNKED